VRPSLTTTEVGENMINLIQVPYDHYSDNEIV